MALMQTVCPNCRKSTPIDDSMESSYCIYCGRKLINLGDGKVRVDNSDIIRNLKTLCEKDTDKHNYDDLKEHSDRIIDKNTEDHLAWYYKGMSAAGLRKFRAAYGYWLGCGELCDDKGFLVKVYDDVPRAVVKSLRSKGNTPMDDLVHVADYRELINGFRKRGIDPEKVYAIPFVMTEEICKLFSEPAPMRRMYTYYLALALVSLDVISNYCDLDIVSEALFRLWKSAMDVLNNFTKYDDYDDSMPKSVELFGLFCKETYDQLKKMSEEDPELHIKIRERWGGEAFLPYHEYFERALDTAFAFGPRNNRGKDNVMFMRYQSKSFIRRYVG